MRVRRLVGGIWIGALLGCLAWGCTSILGNFTDGTADAGPTPTSDGSSGRDVGAETGQSGDAAPDASGTLTIAPTSHAFGIETVAGVAGPTQTFTVTNGSSSASGSLTASLAVGQGTAATEFQITAAGDGCTGKSLAPGGTCTVEVKFNPATYGDKSASLNINGGPPAATMTGTGEDFLALTVMKAGAGTGTVTDSSGMITCGATCSAVYPRTTSDPMVTLSATAGTASTFSGWSGGGCSGTGQCVVTLSTAATTVTATFAPQWTVLGTSSAIVAYVPTLTTALGNFLYLGSASQFASFNLTTNIFSTLAPQSEFSEDGPLAAGSTYLYYLYNTGLLQYTPGSNDWSTLISNDGTDGSGMSAYNSTVYVFGASPPYAGWWDQVGSSLNALGNMPAQIGGACTGVDTSHGLLYVFGGDTPTSANGDTYAYTITSSSWATVATNGPLTCQRMAATSWNGNLVYADTQGVHQFNFTSGTWAATPLPLPNPAPQNPVALSPGSMLYLLGYDGTSTTTVYQYNP